MHIIDPSPKIANAIKNKRCEGISLLFGDRAQ